MDHADGAISGNWTLNAAEAEIAKKSLKVQVSMTHLENHLKIGLKII